MEVKRTLDKVYKDANIFNISVLVLYDKIILIWYQLECLDLLINEVDLLVIIPR